MIEIENITDAMLHLNGLKAVIFDLDDTLYSEKEYVRSGYRAIGTVLPQIKDIETKLWKEFESKNAALDKVLTDEGIYTEELKQKCLEAYRYHKPEIHLYEGVVEMLITLKKQGFIIGIITDGRPEGQRLKIEVLDLAKYIDYIIVTDELGGIECRKPNETSFVLMKEYVGVEYNEMCYVGDNIKKDFVAPDKLGMKSIWFKNQEGIYAPLGKEHTSASALL